MELAQVKRNFNKPVNFVPNGKLYLLTACILRENRKGEYFYQAELQDQKAPHSILICKLEDVEEITK